MERKVKLLLSTGITIGILGLIPFKVNAISTKKAIKVSTNKTEAGFIKKADPTHYKYYTTKHNSTNKLFKQTIDGYSFWTPVRPKIGKGGISTTEYLMENVKTAHSYSGGIFGNLWTPNPSLTRNFKNAQMKLGWDDKRITRSQMKKKGAGYAVEDSPFVNHGGSKSLKNKSGQWRFNGYTTGGEAISNPRFPIEYTQSTVAKAGWKEYAKASANLFRTTIYDTKDYKSAKKNMIKRLLNEYPSMKKVYSVDKWMKILSLQTEPEKNLVFLLQHKI